MPMLRHLLAALAALLLSAVPAAAGAQAVAQPVEAFHAARKDKPLWLVDGAPGPAAERLLLLLERAPLDGFADGPRLAADIDVALSLVASGAPAARAERLLSAAWVGYVRALKAPVNGILYGDPQRALQPPVAEAILRDAAEAPSLEDHVRTVSEVNPFYAAMRDAVWAHRQSQPDGRIADRRILASLDRLRLLPAKGRFVLVDVAGARLSMVEDGRVRDTMKVIVGKPEYATPLIASTIHYLTFNPYWHVPTDMVRRTIAPNVQKQGRAYLAARGYELFEGFGTDPAPLAFQDVDWKAVEAGTRQIMVRQLPGPTNAMGGMKIHFPNGQDIYLHDTPQKDLLEGAARTLSAGCVRLEDAGRLAHWLFGSEPRAPSPAPEQHVALPEGVPVYLTYLTARVDGDAIQFAEDVYGLDRTPTTVAGVAGAAP